MTPNERKQRARDLRVTVSAPPEEGAKRCVGEGPHSGCARTGMLWTPEIPFCFQHAPAEVQIIAELRTIAYVERAVALWDEAKREVPFPPDLLDAFDFDGR